ncbi:MAG: hypothetical protein COU68_04200, partial [Candidatus Pacebacteria bacterium CG10_big_fil_rev_8_21_14_0_10_45_6]
MPKNTAQYRYVWIASLLIIAVVSIAAFVFLQPQASVPNSTVVGDNDVEPDMGIEVPEPKERELDDLIRVTTPQTDAAVASPLTVTGEARGTWYFEADFPVELLDAAGVVIAQGIAQAQGSWMTEEFVPFEVTLTFDTPTNDNGTLVFKKNNPSGLPENDNELRLPVIFTQ